MWPGPEKSGPLEEGARGGSKTACPTQMGEDTLRTCLQGQATVNGRSQTDQRPEKAPHSLPATCHAEEEHPGFSISQGLGSVQG